MKLEKRYSSKLFSNHLICHKGVSTNHTNRQYENPECCRFGLRMGLFECLR